MRKILLVFLFCTTGCGNSGSYHNKAIQAVIIIPKDILAKELLFPTPPSQVDLDNMNKSNYLFRIKDSTCIFPINNAILNSLREGIIVDLIVNKDSLEKAKKDTTPYKDTIDNKVETIFFMDVQVRTREYNELNYILGWLQMTISIAVIFITFSIWISFHIKRIKSKDYNIKSITEELVNDKGILLLNLALLFWAAIGLIHIYSPDTPTKGILIRIFSIVNNMFFFLSFPHFNHGIAQFKKNKIFYEIGAIAISIGALIAMAIWHNDVKGLEILKKIDIFYSTIVLSLFGYLLYKSFANREFKLISKLVAIMTICAVMGQIAPHINGMQVVMGDFLPINYYTSFIIISTSLVALMFSWYNEERENLITEKFIETQEYVSNLGIDKANKKAHLSKLIIEEDIENVVNSLYSLADEGMKVELTEVIRRFRSLKKDRLSGIINHENYLIEKNKCFLFLQDCIKNLFNNAR